jgi:dolichol kinase
MSDLKTQDSNISNIDKPIIGGIKSRFDQHLARNIWHMTMVMAVFWSYRTYNHDIFFTGFGILSALFILIDFIRVHNGKVNRVILNVFYFIIRDNEIRHYAGTTFLLFGVWSIAFWAEPIVFAQTLLILAFVDPLAAIIGKNFGKIKIYKNKSWAGTIAAFATSAIVTAIFFQSEIAFNNFSDLNFWILCISLGFVGAFAELIMIYKLDDNASIPVINAALVTLILNLFGANI